MLQAVIIARMIHMLGVSADVKQELSACTFYKKYTGQNLYKQYDFCLNKLGVRRVNNDRSMDGRSTMDRRTKR